MTMQARQLQTTLSPEDYLALERQADVRHQYVNGEIFAMAGESLEHSTICFNIAAIIGAQLRGKPCRGFSPNMKVRTRPDGLYTYPDLAVVCGEPVFHDERRDVLVNPKLVVEVLSPSTEAYDRGGKWIRYQQIETLSEYLLIAQDQPLIEHYTRQADGKWLYFTVRDLADTVDLPAIDCRLPLAEVYDRIRFSEELPAAANP